MFSYRKRVIGSLSQACLIWCKCWLICKLRTSCKCCKFYTICKKQYSHIARSSTQHNKPIKFAKSSTISETWGGSPNAYGYLLLIKKKTITVKGNNCTYSASLYKVSTRWPWANRQNVHNLQINQHLYQTSRTYDRLPITLFLYGNMFNIYVLQ